MRLGELSLFVPSYNITMIAPRCTVCQSSRVLSFAHSLDPYPSINESLPTSPKFSIWSQKRCGLKLVQIQLGVDPALCYAAALPADQSGQQRSLHGPGVGFSAQDPGLKATQPISLLPPMEHSLATLHFQRSYFRVGNELQHLFLICCRAFLILPHHQFLLLIDINLRRKHVIHVDLDVFLKQFANPPNESGAVGPARSRSAALPHPRILQS